MIQKNGFRAIGYLPLLVLLTSCAGGGGSSSMPRSTASDEVVTPTTPPATTPISVLLRPDPANFAELKSMYEMSPEYDVRFPVPGLPSSLFSDTHLVRINAAAAYARGATGAGETVVVVDAGILQNHQELAGKVIRASNALQLSRSAPVDTHGTSVASIAVGARRNDQGMHGVAFDADLEFVAVPLGSGGGAYRPLDPATFDEENIGIDMGITINVPVMFGYGVREGRGAIVNHSFGANGAISLYNERQLREILPQTIAVLAQSATNDADKKIVVWAAGNAGNRRIPVIADSPEIFGGLGVFIPELRGHVLTVVALDTIGNIADYSNHCGIAKAFCLAAPGAIYAATADGTDAYGIDFGTSFAAPMVSGALAVLRQFFRNSDGSYQLGNTELVARLLETANNEPGSIYVDSDIYGQGLLDLDAATRPVGAIMTGLPGDPSSHLLADSNIALSGSAFGTFQHALTNVQITGFDSMGAPFPQAPATWLKNPQRLPDSYSRLETQPISLFSSPYQDDGPRLSLGMYNNGLVTDLRLAGKNWWISYGQHGGGSLGLYDRSAGTPQQIRNTAVQLFNDPLAFATPYMSLVRSGPGIGWSHSLAGGGRLGLALTRGTAWFDQQQNSSAGKPGIGALLDYRLTDAGLSLQAGAVHEADGFLGARLQGAFGDAQASTMFIGFNSSWATSSNKGWHILSSAYLGHTRPQTGHTGLLRNAGDIVSSTFSLGATRSSVWHKDDWLGLRLWQPLRAESGVAELHVPVGRTKYGEALYRDHKLDLTPAGRNLQIETAYLIPLNNGKLQTSIGLERHPQHDSGRNTQAFISLSFRKHF